MIALLEVTQCSVAPVAHHHPKQPRAQLAPYCLNYAECALAVARRQHADFDLGQPTRIRWVDDVGFFTNR